MKKRKISLKWWWQAIHDAHGRWKTNYFDQSTGIMLSQMDMMGKKYLIVDTLKTAPGIWDRDKAIQGYDCMQAITPLMMNANRLSPHGIR